MIAGRDDSSYSITAADPLFVLNFPSRVDRTGGQRRGEPQGAGEPDGPPYAAHLQRTATGSGRDGTRVRLERKVPGWGSSSCSPG